ncbi:MAG: cyclic nucleotide-binding domain-containing protein, partial [Chloroflexi bacterium]|nr:cyclic nucleotide-binding domain-containing protein [Chloroflexota bacterium]
SAERTGHHYGIALSSSLEAGQYRVLRHAAGEWGPSDTTSIHSLIAELNNLPLASRESLLIAEVISQSHLKEGYEELTRRFKNIPAEIKAELLSIIITGWPDVSMLEANQRLITDALQSENPDLRRTALRLVATYPELDPNYQVAQLLLDEDPEVNIVSASALMHHPSAQIREAARSQLRWLSGHRNGSVRVSAVKSLVAGSLNKFGEIIYPLQVDRFLSDPATRVREAALGAATMQQLVHSVCDPSQNVRRTAIRHLSERRFEGARRYILAAITELDMVDALSSHVQIENCLCRWRLKSALSKVSTRFGKRQVLRTLHDGFEHLDLIDSMAYTLRKLHLPALDPLIKQLQLDYDTLLQGLIEFLAFVYDEQQVNAAIWTLMSPGVEEQHKTARRVLMHLTNEQYAIAFETCLHIVAGQHERLETGLPRSVMEAMLGQYDDWRPLLSLYTIINLPPENRTWFDVEFAEHLLAERIQSSEPAIREASRFIQQRLHEEEDAPRRVEEYTEEVIEEVVMLSMLERMIFLRNVSFFGDLRIDQLRALARVCDELAFAEGRRIIKQGEPGDGLYIIVEGEVNILRQVSDGNPVHLFTLSAPEVFGEISLLDGGVRSADVVANTPVLLLGIKREALNDALQDDPSIAMGMLRTMAQRIRRTTETIDQHATHSMGN